MTKCGRYVGLDRQFDYSPAWLRASVNLSLSRLKTGYLDTVYLHDVEFVCTPVTQRAMGNPVHVLEDEKEDSGLAEGQEGMVRGKGDQIVLDAIAELRKMQDEGLIKNIGISGEYVSPLSSRAEQNKWFRNRISSSNLTSHCPASST